MPLALLILSPSGERLAALAAPLERHGFALRCEHLGAIEGLGALAAARAWDVVLCEHAPPVLDALAGLGAARACAIDAPFIVVADGLDETRIVELIEAGVREVVSAATASRLVPAILRELKDAALRERTSRALTERDGLLQALTDNMPIAVTNVDAKLRYRYVNQTVARWCASTKDEVIGKTIPEVLGASAHQSLALFLERALSGASTPFNAAIAYPDGVTREIEGVYIPSRGPHGKVTGVVAMSIDMTARNQAERALRESEERFRGAFETAPHGMAIVATSGKLLKVNQALCRMVGYAEAELLERDFQSITHPDDLDQDLAYVRQCLDGTISTYQMEKRYFRKGGAVAWILLSVSIVRSAQNEPLYFVSQMLDFTARKETEAQLVQAQKMEAVGQLTGGVAHDFNNLLTVIIGNVRLLERRVHDDAAAKQLASIAGAAKRGADLTHRLLAFGRRGNLQPESVDCRSLISDMLDLLRRTLGETIEIASSFADDLHNIYADPGQLETTLLNLATNARDAMPKGGTLSIDMSNLRLGEPVSRPSRLSKLVCGDYVLLAVSDTGVGIPAARLNRIFEPFFTTKNVGKGTGLGLSMVFGFVNQSGGHVEVESVEGKGTTFRLYLPATSEATSGRPERPLLEPLWVQERKTILVVEDEREVRDIVVTLLSDLGYRVIEAENGPDALARLARHPDIDLIFSDVVMPGGLSGFELAELARKLRPGIKVLFATGYADAALIGWKHVPSPDWVLQKPYEKAELAAKIHGALFGPAEGARRAVSRA